MIVTDRRWLWKRLDEAMDRVGDARGCARAGDNLGLVEQAVSALNALRAIVRVCTERDLLSE